MGATLLKRCVTAWTAIALALVAVPSPAQTYPSKPVRVIVPYTPGGGVDIMARIFATRLSEKLGAQFVVENRGGGGTIIGTELVAKAAADGYTLLFANPALVAAPALNEKLPYDTLKSFTGVVMVAASFNVLVVHPALPVKTVKDLVALAKARPGQLNFASAGEGSAIHLAMAQFVNASGIDVVHIPYKGAAPALTDVVAGHVPLMMAATPPAIPYIKSGRLRALGVSSTQRLALLPDVPTIAESGYPGFEINNWYGIVAPAETPKQIVARLNAEINTLLDAGDMRERIASLGAERAGGTPEQFEQRIRSEMQMWQNVFEKSNRKGVR
jgi:tripartite-type tricarboxylate transporter receptor subunit TctC